MEINRLIKSGDKSLIRQILDTQQGLLDVAEDGAETGQQYFDVALQGLDILTKLAILRAEKAGIKVETVIKSPS